MKKVGVIVARFQVAQLTQGHRDLIDHVQSQNERVLIVLGVTQSLQTARNPLPYELRRAMVLSAYPHVEVAFLNDNPSDEAWSRSLDALIAGLCPDCKVTLYGSRDSFLEYYSGGYPTEKFQAKHECSGTDLRKTMYTRSRWDRNFLAGIIYDQVNRPPVVYQTVDIAVLHTIEPKILLAAKSTDGDKLRFIGGFVDPTDTSLEMAARREVIEETSGIAVDDFRYVGSMKVEDWRYKGTEDSIMTTFFRALYIFGCTFKPADDIVKLEWVPLEELMNILVEEHKPLGEMLLKTLNND